MSWKLINFTNENLPIPDFFDFTNSSVTSSSMLYSSANFFRNVSNSNIKIIIPLGPDISPNTIWLSPNIYLPNNIFNSIKSLNEVQYEFNKDVRIIADIVFLHDILIQFKITKSDDSNFINQRELRCTLVKEDGVTVYDSSFYSNQQPDSGSHDYIILRGHITHNLNDLIKLKINIVQDDKLVGKSDTALTIFRISWNILGLKEA